MSAEGMPPTEPSLLARPLRLLTAGAVRAPVAVIALACTAALFALLYTTSGLGFKTSRLDLLNPECSHNQIWCDYIKEFGDQDDAVIVVQGSDREEIVPVLRELSAALVSEDRYFHAVLHEIDSSKLRSKGLYFLPTADVAAIEPFLDEVTPVLQGDWSRLKLSNMIDQLCLQLHDIRFAAQREVTLDRLDRLATTLLARLTGQDVYESPWPESPLAAMAMSDSGPEYVLLKEGRWGVILLRLAVNDTSSFAPGSEAIDELRRLTAKAEARHPNVKIGLTGLPVLENDEMRSSQKAMLRASVVSFFGVACLFIAAFGGLRHPLMTIVALLLAMAWSFGYITLAVGHLNILSIAFGVILIGLGIDFGVHYTARYLQLRHNALPSDLALCETASSVGPGIVTGAVTTAIAFFMAGFTDFTGVAELGIIAGGGILLCCVAAMLVLPAMLYVSDSRRPHQLLPVPLDYRPWLRPILSRPRFVLLLSLAGTIGLAAGMARLTYDHNLLNLQAEGLESVELEQELLGESDQSAWFALSITDSREELEARKKEFLKLPTIERVEDIFESLGTDHEKKRPIIERIQSRLAHLPERPPIIPIDAPAELGNSLRSAQVLVGRGPRAQRIAYRLEQVREAIRRLTESECRTRLDACQHGLASDVLSQLFRLRSAANPEPPTLDDLPEGRVARFVGQNRDRYLMRIYSNRDIWDMDAMEQFVKEVRSVDPKATGNPLQTYEASRQMKASYERAAWYALAAIVVVLFLDFESIGYTLLAMLPLGLGMAQMFGILGLLGIPLNPANMIVLPLILGIGVDDGVHVVHDFRRQRGRYEISASTAASVLITSLTTMIGLGSLMIAKHQGLQSLGRVLTIGVSCCLFTSLIMLPAILTWATRHRQDESDESTIQSRQRPHRRHEPASHPGTSSHAVSRAPRGAVSLPAHTGSDER
ncbi:MAG: MMPL family transporter [Pirellulales bacterium]|nr:MMPL family transporter [Pirellulales bacterium]